MKLQRLYALRPREIEAIHDSLGGKFDYKERLARGGTGSPFLYYLEGHPELDILNQRASDMLRINFEEFRNGLMVGISERTEPYILPLKPEEIRYIWVRMEPEKVQPRQGSLFHSLLKYKIPLSFARFFAGSTEYEEPKAMLTLHTCAYPVHCWTMSSAFRSLKGFFEKSGFAYLLKQAEA